MKPVMAKLKHKPTDSGEGRGQVLTERGGRGGRRNCHSVCGVGAMFVFGVEAIEYV